MAQVQPPASVPESTGTMDVPRCARITTGRKLVVCIDGTSNQFSVRVRATTPVTVLLLIFQVAQNTNVVELYSRLEKHDAQLTYYNSGIGTYVKDSNSWLSWHAWKQWFDNLLDLMFAWSAQKTLKSHHKENLNMFVGTSKVR